MHPSARLTAEKFFEVYGSSIPRTGKVLDIGSQDVNGSLRDVCPGELDYVGVDFVSGQNVEVVLEDPYSLPFPDGSAGAVVSSSCLEHSEFFWILFVEMSRVLAPGGLLYVNSPSNGVFHRYPVDCWRFYPDSGEAMAKWARRSGHDMHLVESFIGPEEGWIWNDFVAVFQKGPVTIDRVGRLAAARPGAENIRTHHSARIENYQEAPLDKRVRWALEKQAGSAPEIVASATAGNHGFVDSGSDGAVDAPYCRVCGGKAFTQHPILWPELIAQWGLSSADAASIERQQGLYCDVCSANLRVSALAGAICKTWGRAFTVRSAVMDPLRSATAVLDLNGCAGLSGELSRLAGYVRADHPSIDLDHLAFDDDTFDLVIHSDTLEHVAHPVRALEECRRVLKPGGSLCFTVPTIPGRLTRSRAGLPISRHGREGESRDDYVVHTEFGADVWVFAAQAGFTEVTMHMIEYPAGLAVIAR